MIKRIIRQHTTRGVLILVLTLWVGNAFAAKYFNQCIVQSHAGVGEMLKNSITKHPAQVGINQPIGSEIIVTLYSDDCQVEYADRDKKHQVTWDFNQSVVEAGKGIIGNSFHSPTETPGISLKVTLLDGASAPQLTSEKGVEWIQFHNLPSLNRRIATLPMRKDAMTLQLIKTSNAANAATTIETSAITATARLTAADDEKFAIPVNYDLQLSAEVPRRTCRVTDPNFTRHISDVKLAELQTTQYSNWTTFDYGIECEVPKNFVDIDISPMQPAVAGSKLVIGANEADKDNKVGIQLLVQRKGESTYTPLNTGPDIRLVGVLGKTTVRIPLAARFYRYGQARPGNVQSRFEVMLNYP